jgi:hypothetical protein
VRAGRRHFPRHGQNTSRCRLIHRRRCIEQSQLLQRAALHGSPNKTGVTAAGLPTSSAFVNICRPTSTILISQQPIEKLRRFAHVYWAWWTSKFTTSSTVMARDSIANIQQSIWKGCNEIAASLVWLDWAWCGRSKSMAHGGGTSKHTTINHYFSIQLLIASIMAMTSSLLRRRIISCSTLV